MLPFLNTDTTRLHFAQNPLKQTRLYKNVKKKVIFPLDDGKALSTWNVNLRR